MSLHNVSHLLTSNFTGDARNATQTAPPAWKPSKQLKIVLCTLYVIIFLCGATGNGLVLFVLGIKKVMKTSLDVLLIALAFADFLASVFGPLVMIGDLVGDLRKWYFGAAMCKLFPAISPITLIASSWLLTVISYDRVRIISRNAASPRKVNLVQVILQLAMAWLIAIGASLPYVMGSKLHGQECYATLPFTNNIAVIYISIWVFIGWGIPLIVTTVLCITTIRILKRRVLRASDNSIVLRRIEMNRKVFKMLITIVMVFFLLTTPYSLFYAVSTYLMLLRPAHTNLNVLAQLNCALFVLMVANSCVNPMIYAKMHREMNKYAQMLWKKLKCNRFGNSYFDKSNELVSPCKNKLSTRRTRTNSNVETDSNSSYS